MFKIKKMKRIIEKIIGRCQRLLMLFTISKIKNKIFFSDMEIFNEENDYTGTVAESNLDYYSVWPELFLDDENYCKDVNKKP